MKGRILVVDDSPIMRRTMIRALGEAGVPFEEITEAHNGLEALHVLERIGNFQSTRRHLHDAHFRERAANVQAFVRTVIHEEERIEADVERCGDRPKIRRLVVPVDLDRGEVLCRQRTVRVLTQNFDDIRVLISAAESEQKPARAIVEQPSLKRLESVARVFRAKLNAGFQSDQDAVDTTWLNRFRTNLQSAKVEVRVELGRTEMNVRDFLSLKVGDLVNLDQEVDKPLNVTVEGITKFRGYQGSFKGHQALKVSELVHKPPQVDEILLL